MNYKKSEAKVDAIVNEVLDENRKDAAQSQDCPNNCERSQSMPKEIPWQCKCAIEISSRFSLRVMEAMRALQRDVDQPPTSSAEDIVDYIRANYRSDGDLYAQVRTALRQVCSQGFVLELLRNEYHLVGPVVSTKRKYGCSLDCEGRADLPTMDDISRRRDNNNRENGPPRRTPQTTFEESIDERDIADRGDVEEFVPRRDQRRDKAEPIPGPSREFERTPSRMPNDKKVRLDDRGDVQRADEMEAGCVVCNAEEARAPHERPRGRPRDHIPRGNRRGRGRPRENGEQDEENDEEDEENDEEDEEVGDDEEERREEDDDDEDTDDSAYRDLKAREPCDRPAARERELKRWIRRCREECERRRRRRRRQR